MLQRCLTEIDQGFLTDESEICVQNPVGYIEEIMKMVKDTSVHFGAFLYGISAIYGKSVDPAAWMTAALLSHYRDGAALRQFLSGLDNDTACEICLQMTEDPEDFIRDTADHISGPLKHWVDLMKEIKGEEWRRAALSVMEFIRRAEPQYQVQ